MPESEDRQLVLVVDDEPGVRQGVAQVLSDQGHTVHTAASGQEALARLAEGAPDLVLLDVRLPGLDGVKYIVK